MVEAGFCTKCGAPKRPGAAFCARCGATFGPPDAPLGTLPPPSPPAPPTPGPPGVPPVAWSPPPPPGPSPATAIGTIRPAVGGTGPGGAIRRKLLPILLVGFIAYLDYLEHSDSGPFLQIVMGAIAVVLILFGHEIAERTGLSATIQQIPAKIRPVLMALPPTLWFAIRDGGTSGAGVAVMIVTLGLVAIISFFGPQIDAALVGFYAARDRTLPRWARLALVIVLPVLISLIVVHGSLAALPVLFQGTTNSSKSAQGRAGLIVFSVVLSAVIALLLMREAET